MADDSIKGWGLRAGVMGSQAPEGQWVKNQVSNNILIELINEIRAGNVCFYLVSDLILRGKIRDVQEQGIIDNLLKDVGLKDMTKGYEDK